MFNQTIARFGHPRSLVREYDHWLVLLRPAQVTAGSLVLAAKSTVLAYGALAPEAFVEQGLVIADIEQSLHHALAYERINYLMLMMVDPHVHFHVIPRYQGSRSLAGIEIDDRGWPGPPDLKSAVPLDDQALTRGVEEIAGQWRSANTNAF